MEIFDLVAKLTLNTKEYETALKQAESQGSGTDVEANLSLNTSDFDTKIAEAEGAEVSDPRSPNLALDKSSFDSAVEAAESEEVDDPDSPDLDLDSTNFYSAVESAEGTDVTDPASPNLELETSGFYSSVEAAENTTVTDPASPTLGLDTEVFYSAVAEASSVEIDDPSAPALDLDTEKFYSAVEAVESEEVDDPEPPELDLNTEPFYTAISEAESTDVTDLDSPSIDLDHSGFDTGLSEVMDGASLFSVDISDIFAGIKEHIMLGAAALGVTTLVNDLSEAVDLARSLGDNVDKSSRAMSLSTDAYQEWSHILDINGANITDLNRGLMNMRKLMGGGEVTKEVSEAFGALGIDVDHVNESFTSTEGLLEYVIKKLADFKGTDADRDLIAQTLFGRGGTKLNALFDGTSEDIDELKRQAHELGLVMSEEEVANAAAYNDSLTNFNGAIKGFKTAIVADILPGLTEVYNKLAVLVAFFNPRTHSNSLADMFKESDEQLSEQLVDIEGTSAAAEKMIDKLFSMGDATKLTAEQQAEWKATADWLLTNIPSLSSVIDLDTLSIKGNKEEVAETIKQWKLLAIERAKQTALQEHYNAVAKKTQEWLEKEAEVAQLEAEYEKQKAEAETLARRDFNAMPEDKQQALANRFGVNVNELTSGQIQAALSPANSEWGFSYYASEELKKSWAQGSTAMESTAEKIKDAKEEADSLKQEVEQGEKDLETYDTAITKVVNGLISSAQDATEEVTDLQTALDNLPDEKTVVITTTTGNSHAKGSAYIPFDNYPALLHRGEAVLTASEARRYREGEGNGGINTGLLAEVVERAIREGMAGVSVNSYLSGKDITDDVSRNTGRQLKARRFRG